MGAGEVTQGGTLASFPHIITKEEYPMSLFYKNFRLIFDNYAVDPDDRNRFPKIVPDRKMINNIIKELYELHEKEQKLSEKQSIY